VKRTDFDLRQADLTDLDALAALEQTCFKHDRLSRRQWRHMLSKAHARTWVVVDRGRLIAHVLVLFNRATAIARLYSIAVDPEYRGRSLARRLVETAEREALRQGRAYMRLEVRSDNKASLGLFESLGYRQIGVVPDYYEDHMQAERLEKHLVDATAPPTRRIPYYRQTLNFTCGAAALMMALAALLPRFRPSRTLELRLWREATTIFMASGHGGCGPLGLALAAQQRGLAAEVWVSDEGIPLIDSVRSEEKKEVMRLVHEEMSTEAEAARIPVFHRGLSLEALDECLAEGKIPLVLISSYHLYGNKEAHWLVVTGSDDHFVYAHDPFVDTEEGETEIDSINMPIARQLFSRMARYGKAGLQAAVVLSKAGKGSKKCLRT